MTRLTKTGGREATNGVIPGRFALSVGKPLIIEPADFRWTALNSVARLESGHTPSRSKSAYWNGGIPWIGIRDATRNHGKKIFDTEQHVSQLGLDNSSARLLPAGTVCLSRTASVGFVVTMGVPMSTSQDFVNWVCGDALSPRYLHYILVGEQESVRRFAHGTTHQTMYYPEAKALHALLPSRATQDAIVEVLGALDDKIAANSQLEGTILDYLAASYELAVADESRTVTVGDVAQFHNRRRIPLSASERQARKGPVPYHGATGIFDYVDEAIFDENLVLVGEDGSVVQPNGQPVVQYIWGPAWVNNHAHVLKGVGISTELLRFALGRANVAPIVTGAVQPKISMGNLKALEIEVPPASSLGQMAQLVAAYSSILRAKSEETRTLTQVRDALLPQLMSGKIRVKDGARAVEEVV